ncbi:MAG: N-6 DNA methylase [Microscillaceae bacterium]|jgi:predicted helicase|nr:N-6 DNA methylase [Microscillaceae bacterium]
MTIQQYIDNLNQRYQLGNATEHTFRGDLQQLIETLEPSIQATNEPKRQKCGAPDYILTKKDIPIGFIEAKDIGDKDLDGTKKTGNQEQFDRYKASLTNLIFTDYLNFHLYREGQFVMKIAIGEVKNGKIVGLVNNYPQFISFIKEFCLHIGQTITSPKKLAQMMAGKARMLADVIEKSLINDTITAEDSTLKDQMLAFKEILIHDITPQGFADVYAQTIAYGMFAARLHDPTLPTFSRQEAAELIPKSNPFLRKLFSYIAGPDIDDRIKWIVDSLVDLFLACNVEELLKDYGKDTQTEDPIIHFYETFLSEYDPALRKARGVWYTPAPVVNFMVRAVDDILKTEFDLPQGLADTSKTKVQIKLQETDKRYKENVKTIEEEVHKVQILDPATGTGTFLAEVVKHIHQKFVGQQGIWSNYVENHLLPRLNGFELLMASYAMAHLKLDLLLTETGYKPTKDQRFRVFLTNSLEEQHPDTSTLFASWLSQEANEANRIKRDTPVMVVMGNPPYSVSSSNKSAWIEKLTADYKKDLNERNIQPLSDDYIKFIRFGQHFIDKNGTGVLAYISNNSFIDGLIHKQMRKHLLESFDNIYILDLHGNAKKKETAPNGSPDQNVFDIMQGVSINLFVKTGKKFKDELAKVWHYDLFGKREVKYNFLNKNTLKSIKWNYLPTSRPNFFFVEKNFEYSNEYEEGFNIDELFENSASGIKSERDNISFQYSINELIKIGDILKNTDIEEFRIKYNNKPDGRDWQMKWAKNDLLLNKPTIMKVLYRPFDFRYTYYSGKSKSFIAYPRDEITKHFKKENIGLITCRQQSTFDFQHILVNKFMGDMCVVSSQTKETGYIFPLYLYPEKKKPKDLFTSISTSEKEKLKLAGRLKQAEIHFEQVSKFFHKTVLPFYEQIKTPDKSQTKLFEENRSTYEEAKATVEQLQLQIELLKSNKPKEVVDDSEEITRVPNLNVQIVRQIAEKLGLLFTSEKESNPNTFAPIDILDYIYAVLHSPTYREKYKEFLKIDFPRVPYPQDTTTFWHLVKLGGELRQIHLLESPLVEQFTTVYPIDGTNLVSKVRFEAQAKTQVGKVYINDYQYFDKVPLVAWEFYIGGYQPAQKWLKDRKDRALSFEDILHYQKIIVALTETHRLMQEIDKMEIF